MGTALALLAERDVEALSGSSETSFDAINHAPAPAAASSRGFPPVWNTDAIRRSFPNQWAEYCRLTFKTAYGIQKAFPGLDSKTARAWIKGDHGPSGCFVAAVVAHDPNAISILMGAA